MLRHLIAAVLSVILADTTPMPRANLAITHVTIVDVVEGTTRADQTVLVAGNRIADIGPAAAMRVPATATVLDGSRKFLIPGLWDMHSHVLNFGPTSLDLCLAQGITSVRDMGAQRFADARAWRDLIAAGQLRGPRMRIASPIVENRAWLAAVKRMNERAGTPWTLHERVGFSSPAEAVAWVDRLAALGPDHIKVRNWPAPEIGRALVERARQRGVQVVGHANEPFPRTGIATLEHQIWPPLTVSDARESLWRQLAANGTAFVPTLVTGVIRAEPPDAILARLDSGTIARWQHVPAKTREQWRHQLVQLKQERPMDWAAVQRDDMRNVREMAKAGVTLLAGTDLGAPLIIPGFSLHDELAQLVSAAGLTPLQALRAATLASARAAGVADSIGSVDEGKLADLVLLDANPLVDVRNTTRIRAVVADGRLLTRAELDRFLAEAADGDVPSRR